MENRPPLTSIADPQNLESPNELLSGAAAIKQEEDLAKQKIKALKYLATIGCGCYDKDGKVEKALMAGLVDCTPAVRMAALEAIMYMAESCNPESKYGYCPTKKEQIKKFVEDHSKCDEFHDKLRMMDFTRKVRNKMRDHKIANSCNCRHCRQGGCPGCCGTCCSFAIHEQLAKMAFGEKNGCYIEPVAEIRAAARRAMCICPAPMCEEEEVGNNSGTGEVPETSGEPEGAQEPVPAPLPETDTPGNGTELLPPAPSTTGYPVQQPAATELERDPPPGLQLFRAAGTSNEQGSNFRPCNYSLEDGEIRIARTGGTYDAMVEYKSKGEPTALVAVKNRTLFKPNTRVKCHVGNQTTVMALVTDSRPGKIAIKLESTEDLRMLRPGTSLALHCLPTYLK